jgi:hypothetical protein
VIDAKSEHREGGHNMNLDSDLGETQFTNLINYAQEQLRRAEQDVDMQKVVRAARELFRAAKKLDEPRKQQAFYACLAVAAVEWGWNGNGG